MPKYVFSYRAPAGDAPGSEDASAAWRAFIGGLGPALADIGMPVFERRGIGETGAGTVLGGYSIVTADDLDAAVALAQGCPTIARGGGVEVGELTPLSAEELAVAERAGAAA